MGLQWYGNSDWDDDRPPTSPVSVRCTKCGEQLTWWKPVFYNGPPPKHEFKCNGVVELIKSNNNEAISNNNQKVSE
jgi:hypothetical protein